MSGAKKDPKAVKGQLVVLSIDGLCRDAIGAYGCRWNQTPALDALAAGGWTLDRCHLDLDSPVPAMDRFWDADAVERMNDRGTTVLVTDDPAVEEQADVFERVVFVPRSTDSPIGSTDEPPIPADSPVAADNVAETHLAGVMMAAIEAELECLENTGEAPELIWIHSRFLRDVWDAPLSLLPAGWDRDVADNDIDNEPDVPTDAETDHRPTVAPEVPAWAEESGVPAGAIDVEADPDRPGRIMQRYAAQVRLIDELLEILLASVSAEDPAVAIVSTGGFALAQNVAADHRAAVGYRSGPLRSSHVHVPMIFSDLGPIRDAMLTTPRPVLKQWLAGGGRVDRDALIRRATAGHESEEAPTSTLVIQTKSDRATGVVTTARWFSVLDDPGVAGGSQQRVLFAKPDDVHDVNDVARRTGDLEDQIESWIRTTDSLPDGE